MSADRVRYTENLSSELEKLGCTKIERIDDMNTLWKTSWGVAIVVPDFGEDKIPTVHWFDVLADIERTRPAK